MVAAGLAYFYQRYGKLEGIADAEARARKRRLGIWKSGQSQTRPWDHRRGLREKGKGPKRWAPRLVAVFALLAVMLLSVQWLWQTYGETLRAILGV